jgi:hypothetical protein
MRREDELTLPERMGLRREPRFDVEEVAKLVLLCVAVGSFAVVPMLM